MALIAASDIEALESTLSSQPPSALDFICAGKDVSEMRRATLARAIELGAETATLATIRDAVRVNRFAHMHLPQHRLALKSRGKGWCRKGRGDNAEWADLESSGYRVSPGKWIVGGADGYDRKGQDEWVVKHVQVGAETWTIAT